MPALPAQTEADPKVDWVPTEVHNWEGKETNVLVLNYTMACALACDFCCYGCHPGRAEKMPLDLALNLVRQAADLGVFSSVGFTGGEATLFLDELLTIGTELRTVGLPFTLATACHWATSPDEAARVVEGLAARGLIRLNVSHDPSHAKFVPASSVINAARAASSLGIATYVVGTFYSTTERLATYVPELVDVPKVKLVDKYVAPVGRALKKNITQETYGLKLELRHLGCYRRIHHDLVVFWDGKAYPCCSTFNRATPGIVLGNAFTDSLQELWERAEGSLMLRIMKRQGFARFYEIIRQYDEELYRELPAVETSVGPCSLCNKLLRRPELSARVHAVFEQYEKDRISQTIDVISERLGEDRAAELIQGVVAPRLTHNAEVSHATT